MFRPKTVSEDEFKALALLFGKKQWETVRGSQVFYSVPAAVTKYRLRGLQTTDISSHGAGG